MKSNGTRRVRRPDSRLFRVRKFVPAALVLLSVAAAAATITTQSVRPTLALLDREGGGSTTPPRPGKTDPLWPAIDEWQRLRQSDRLPFADYAHFLIAHRGWPGEPGMRRVAERQIQPDQSDPSLVAQFFDAFPPLSAAGRVRYAEALASLGQADKARTAAVAAWTMGPLAADDEARLTSKFGSQFTPSQQDQRMEVLLWARATSAASRQLGLVSAQRRPIYAARLAFQTNAPDAATQAAAVGPDAEHDAGFIIDRAFWLRANARELDARTYLAQAETLDSPAFDPTTYLTALLTFANAAAHDRQWGLAYGIAANLDHAFAPGTDIRAQDLKVRDPYTSLAWLAGTTALKQLNRLQDAEAMFRRYAAASQTPGSQAKGEYWAGRAAQLAQYSPLAWLPGVCEAAA